MNDKKELFAQRMTETLNLGALNLALGMGYRLGLFEALAEANAPIGCVELADRAGVSARYLREWLGVMACGRVVELDRDQAGQETYFLPPEHAAYLIRGSELNLGVYTQETPLLTVCAQEDVLERFKDGGGVNYDRYRPFRAFMAQLADAKHRDTLIRTFLPSVDGGALVDRLERGIEVCDLGCGSGLAARLMARAFPNSRFIGLDFDPDEIAAAERLAQKDGLANLSYLVQDAAAVAESPEYTRRFDYITAFDAIHDQTRPAEALAGARFMLKPGGLFSMIDIAAGSDQADNIDHPMGSFLYLVSLMHCLPVGLNDQGAGLGMMWGRQKAVEMLRQAGFSEVTVKEMAFDPFNLHFQCRR